jgi:hypothetical protein
MSNEIGIGNTTTIDLDQLTAEAVENANFERKVVKRGRKGAGSNLAQKLLGGQWVEYLEHKDKRVVEKLRTLGYESYTQWGAFVNSVSPTLKKNGILEPQFEKERYEAEVCGIHLEKVLVKLLKV